MSCASTTSSTTCTTTLFYVIPCSIPSHTHPAPPHIERQQDLYATLVASPTLQQLLKTPAADAHPSTLLLALHLWPCLTSHKGTAVLECPLLPQGVPPPPPGYLTMTDRAAKAAQHPAAAASALCSPQHLQTLLPVLRATSASVPRLHSVWLALLALMLPGFVEQRAPGGAEEGPSVDGGALRDPLQALWGTVVEGDLLHSPSHERKYLGLQLFSMLLPHLPPGLLTVRLCDSMCPQCLVFPTSLRKMHNTIASFPLNRHPLEPTPSESPPSGTNTL